MAEKGQQQVQVQGIRGAMGFELTAGTAPDEVRRLQCSEKRFLGSTTGDRRADSRPQAASLQSMPLLIHPVHSTSSTAYSIRYVDFIAELLGGRPSGVYLLRKHFFLPSPSPSQTHHRHDIRLVSRPPSSRAGMQWRKETKQQEHQIKNHWDTVFRTVVARTSSAVNVRITHRRKSRKKKPRKKMKKWEKTVFAICNPCQLNPRITPLCCN